MIFRLFPGNWLSFVSGAVGGGSATGRATPLGREGAPSTFYLMALRQST